MLGLVKRYKKIKYEGFDMNGNIIKKEAEGLEARVVQHEYDHLMGILYTSRLVDEKAFGFLDVHKLTNRGDGLSNRKWHIDGLHLSPDGMLEAWRQYAYD